MLKVNKDVEALGMQLVEKSFHMIKSHFHANLMTSLIRILKIQHYSIVYENYIEQLVIRTYTSNHNQVPLCCNQEAKTIIASI